MAWKKGQSGRPTGTPVVNPLSKPPKAEESFTFALREAICNNKFTITLKDGSSFSEIPKVEMARYLAQVMMTGTMRLPTGLEMNFTAKEFLETYWNIVNRIDGPPVQMVDQTNRNILQFDAPDTISDRVSAEKVEKIDEVV